MDETTLRDIDGDLEVDLAELSLGQRLAAVGDAGVHRSSESENEGVSPTKSQSTRKKSRSELDVVPANSLTRTLIQALHSSDTRLIETCLAHSNPDLIRNTVRRLPSQLAIPLLNSCVERLGRGARAANMKGGGGGASAQRGMTLVTWIRTVLAVHTGHLMTVSFRFGLPQE
jgi:U3 small nucleolar RNA-associated protein 5